MSAAADNYGFRTTRIDAVRTVTLIEVETTEGAGTPDDIVTQVFRYFNLDGSFVAERDIRDAVQSIGMPMRDAS